ncbi:MAG TPA: lysophospholipid acyltransferase family protein [Kiritimatiellia bacterium]|nr:lysophospholipid acyltransferase family protein [Kiritimatiellia bacterium]
MRRVTLLLIRIIGACCQAAPYRAMLGAGRALGWFLRVVLRHRRDVVREALDRCLPERSAGERARILREVYRHLGTVPLECLHFSGPRAESFPTWVDIEGREHAEAVRARGGGALVLMGHIGNWELMGLAAASLWNPLNVVVRPIQNKALDAWWRKSRERMGLRPLPREDAMRDCLKALKRREVVALILDQNMRRHRGIFVDFFGRPACTTPGLAILSYAAKTPVLPVFMIRQRDGRHQLHILPPIEPPADRTEAGIRAATQHYTKTLEDIIRRYPEQWIWIHKRWRTRPQPPIDAPPDNPTPNPP